MFLLGLGLGVFCQGLGFGGWVFNLLVCKVYGAPPFWLMLVCVMHV